MKTQTSQFEMQYKCFLSTSYLIWTGDVTKLVILQPSHVLSGTVFFFPVGNEEEVKTRITALTVWFHSFHSC
jgi:hypothetical protein